MKKKLMTQTIADELRGNSVFFPRNESKPSNPVPPVRVVPPVPSASAQTKQRRVMKQRHPFDIYQDQYESLQQLSLEERKQGGIGSMSAMVREAIDELIAKRRKNLKK